jgi:5,10-methylenetetrahydrofolate reductase
MKISFELNPPRIIANRYFDLNVLNEALQKFIDRTSKIIDLVDGIHLTDSVLGIPRISSVSAASHLKQLNHNNRVVDISCSVRTRDRNFISISQIVSDAVLVGVRSLLILMGDEPAQGSREFGLTPSTALKLLKNEKYNRSLEFRLAIPNKIKSMSSSSIQQKIDAKPDAFVTQSIQSISELGEIADKLKPHKIPIVACIMIPSEKNQLSAEVIGLDWKEYERNPIDFIREAGNIAARGVLLTSPNSFKSAVELLQALRNEPK